MKYIKGIDYIGLTTTFLCHDGKGHVLMNKRSLNCRDEHGCWDPGGGSIEFGKTAVDNLRKEIAEEYCTTVLDYEFLGYRDVLRTQNGKLTHWLSLDFKVLVDRSKVKNGEPHKLDALEWFTLNKLPEPVHSQLPEFLRKYKEKLEL